MFLSVDPVTRFHVFTEQDPRQDGFDGDVEQGVRLDEIQTLDNPALDATLGDPCLGRSPTDDKHFRVFLSVKDCRAEGFQYIAQIYGKYESWREFQADT